MCNFIGKIAYTPANLTEITIRSHSRTVAPIAPQYMRKDGTVEVPLDQFIWEKRVVDEVAYVWTNQVLIPVGRRLADNLPKPECLVVPFESPHRSEYSQNTEFAHIGPLRDKGSRHYFATFLPF